MTFTHLETSLLERLHRRYADVGFPSPRELRMASRKNNGFGRYVEVESSVTVDLPDGHLGLGTYSHIEMQGLPHGMTFLAWIQSNRLTCLEFTPVGDHPWDGVEREWTAFAEEADFGG